MFHEPRLHGSQGHQRQVVLFHPCLEVLYLGVRVQLRLRPRCHSSGGRRGCGARLGLGQPALQRGQSLLARGARTHRLGKLRARHRQLLLQHGEGVCVCIGRVLRLRLLRLLAVLIRRRGRAARLREGRGGCDRGFVAIRARAGGPVRAR